MTLDPTTVYDERAPKGTANLSVNKDLLRQARELGIPLSSTFEEALAAKVREARRKQWLETHAEAFEAIGRRIEREGLWSDGRRLF